MTSYINISKDTRGVSIVSLNRPEKHNAFNGEIITELKQKLTELNDDKDVRVVILTGQGSSFSAGADLEWMRAAADYDEAHNQKDAEQLAQLLNTLYEMDKPTIARVNGPAYGGALGLIVCCDIAIAIDSSHFAFSEVKLGLVPAIISSFVIHAIGHRQAQALFLTAENFSAQHAQHIGLIHQAVAENELDNVIDHQVKQLLAAGPQALAHCKCLLREQKNDLLSSNEHAKLIAKLRVSDEGQEGLQAFLHKRKPRWIQE